MPTVIVLAMHGEPPNDYPHTELKQYFQLHSQVEAMEHSHGHTHGNSNETDIKARFAVLDTKMREWPRSEENDPFYVGSVAVASELEKQIDLPVFLGFNEFCAPSLESAFEEANSYGAARVVVITPMLTPGGSHAEVDIPANVEAARKLYPEMKFLYAWPFDRKKVGSFLAKQVNAHLSFQRELEDGWR